MKKISVISLFLIALAPLLISVAAADEASSQNNSEVETSPSAEEYGEKKPQKAFQFNLEMVNLFVYRNDSDFDRSEPAYDKYGQSVGFFGTFLKPMLALTLGTPVKVYYEAEIGLDLWARNTPDNAIGSKDGTELSFKQREIWAEVKAGGFFAKAGFQHYQGVGGLFVNHWIGAGRFGYDAKNAGAITLTIGQMPDQTFQGWEITKNSFANDCILSSLEWSLTTESKLKFDAGVYYLYDASVIDRARHIGAAEVAAGFENENFFGFAAFSTQFGRAKKMSSDGSDAKLLAFGGTLKGGVKLGAFSANITAIALSSDDDYTGNDDFGYLWSGKRAGDSILLSENEIRAMGDNLDLKMGVWERGFYSMNAGLAAVDFGVYYQLTSWFKAGAVFAGLFVLNPENANGSAFVGSENELVLNASLYDGIVNFVITGGILAPGGAGAAKANLLENRLATDKIYFTQGAFVLKI